MRIAFIGCGNMGEAILAGLHTRHVCYVCEPRPERQALLKKKYRITCAMLLDAVRAADVVILAVKPQELPEVLAELRAAGVRDKLIVSIAAGVTTALIEKRLGGAKVIRVMPNLPATINEGMSGICRGKRATPKDAVLVQGFFEAVGKTVMVPEKMMDAVTAVSGSGPAYVFLVVESLIKAARSLGFDKAQAKALVYQTLLGSAHLLEKSADDADVLRQKVTSKGGTTQAAIDVFMKKDVAGIFTAALKAAHQRARQLSK